MEFVGYIEEPVYDSNGNIAYTQYTMKWRSVDD